MRQIRYFSILISSIFVLTAASTLAAAEPTGPVPGRFVVKLKAGAKFETSRSLSDGRTVKPLSPIIARPDLRGAESISRYRIFSDPTGQLTAPDIVALLGADNVEYVEQDHYLEFFDFPTDDLFSDQWYLYNSGQSYLGIIRVAGNENDTLTTKSGTAGKDVRLVNEYVSPPAETTKVVVAIVDTGVDIVHPQLQGRLWHNPDEIADGIDNDHNGFIDDTLGYDVSGDALTFGEPIGDNDPTDLVGHGTHIAGIVAASSDGIGTVGIAPFAEIMAVKIRPNATSAVGAAGIFYAINAGAQIISISWGSPFESGILREALDLARLNGVFVCIAPGNTGDNTRYFPAAFDSTFVVGAGNSDGFMTYFSTFGAHVDIVAPGQDILSLRAAGTDLYEDQEPGLRIIDSLYYLSDGTSMATPMVAGAAAVLLAFRPQLGLDDLENLLLSGATDIVDPWGLGDSYPGVDTITGHGYLNIDASLSLALGGGLSIAEPVRRGRYTEDVVVRVNPVAGYSASWLLEYSVGEGSTDWQALAVGFSTPADSILFVLSDTTLNGIVNLRLQAGTFESWTSFTYVRETATTLSRPFDGEEIKYSIGIRGSAYGPQYDSVTVGYSKFNGVSGKLFSSTSEFFDSLLYNWTISGVDTGNFVIRMTGHYSWGTQVDSVNIHVLSGFAVGWPQSYGGNGSVTPVSADLDKDGSNELIVATSRGLFVFGIDGSIRQGFPVPPNVDSRCVPAVYDIDRDGWDEIIFTTDSAIHAVNHDGSYVPGWPVTVFTGLSPYQYAYPNPTIAELGYGEDSAIVIVNATGQIMAFEFNGDPYFYSLEGHFGSVGASTIDGNVYTGNVSPMVTSADLDGDGLYEVVVSYSSSHAGGLALLEGRTGRPAFGMSTPLAQSTRAVNGAVLADLDGDQLQDVVMLAYQYVPIGGDSTLVPVLYAKKSGVIDLPGWPIALPDLPRNSWIASFPVAADLDLDDDPEILVTFFTYAKSYLYIFNSDGSSYTGSGSIGPAFEASSSLMGTPTVGNLTGDDYPEIAFRAGHILPGTGPEYLYVLNNAAELLNGYPIITPATPSQVLSSRYAPLIQDIDNDGLQELAILSDNATVLVWDFDGLSADSPNHGRFLGDNMNSNKFPVAAHGIVTHVGDAELTLPRKLELFQNYPNPFNPSTTIRFTLPSPARVRLEMLNILGQRVKTLIDGELGAGVHQVLIDGTDLASGVYFYRLTQGDNILNKKMMLLK